MEDKADPLLSTIESIAPDKLSEMKDRLSKELETSGSKHAEAAARFQAGLDKVIDVLLILVLKFGRATTMLLVMGILNIICVVTLIVATVHVTALRSEVRDLMDHQEEFARSQKRIERTTTETKQDVATTSQKVSETQAKVETAAEAAPKVEVDAKTGKAKLVVPVTEARAKATPVKKPVPKPTPGAKVEFNLE
jgi:hypothetical protein